MSFQGAGQQPGLEIWRIENFEAVPYDKSSYGKFNTGDSYIVLSTTDRGRGQLSWNLHFWLGHETSQDESGTAAIKSVELDDELGGRPVQHREVEGHESALFISHFKKGIKYLPGGVKSGFSHVDPDDDEKRLFQIKGKRNIKIKQVPLDASSLNKSDCFILDCGKNHDILVFMPPGARRVEKFKASQAALEIRDEDHAGKGNVVVLDENANQSLFFSELGSGSVDSIAEGSNDDDEETEKATNTGVRLYQVSGDDGSLDVTEVSGKPLDQGMLKSGDCFILASGGSNGIYVWIGKESSKEERIQAMKSGEAFLKKFGLPNWTKVERVVEGGEPALFKQFFKSWKEGTESGHVGLGRVYSPGSIAEWDINSLHSDARQRISKSGGEAIGFMPDDGKGQKEIFRIENLELVPLSEDVYGKFFGGDSYVIKYTYEKNSRQGYIIYFWQGAESSQDEKAAAAINAVKMDNELSGRAVQVRVVQGSEPRHFIKMFGGKMVVFTGGKASGFRNVHDSDFYDTDGTRMFRVRGTGPDDIRAVQVPEVAASLNSEDVFILETPSKTWIWKGQASTDEELAAAEGLLDVVSPGRSSAVLQESNEAEEFWTAIGGKGDYSRFAKNYERPILEARLFHCRITGPSRKMTANELFNFDKEDLASDDVMMLDSGAELYIWIGNEASEEEKEKALTFAKSYLATDPTERDETNTLIFTVKEGDEPSSFTCLFPVF